MTTPPFKPGQAYVYSLMPREYLIDRLTAGDRLYAGPFGQLSFTAPRRRGQTLHFYQDAPAQLGVLAELLREGWAEAEPDTTWPIYVRRKLKGRHVKYGAGWATIVGVKMVWHARAGAAADLQLADGRIVREVLADLHLLPE